MESATCRGLQATIARQLTSGGHSMDAVEPTCTCLPNRYLGTGSEHVMVMACLWVAFALSVIILLYYCYHTYLGTCGWEEVYVVTVEMLKTIIEVFFEADTPATIVQFNGVYISWLRYSEWLLTCPVILIHLSNLTGLGHYNKRTMRLIVSDIGTIVCGVTAALCNPPAKVAFFVLGLCYGASTFITAASVYISAHREVPNGECKLLGKLCAWVFFGSWVLFPLLFLMGPEGFGHLTPWGSIIAHTFADLLSKNLWGLLAHHLRNKIQEHIKEHGSLEAIPADEEQKQQGNKSSSCRLGKASTSSMSCAGVGGFTTAAADTGAVALITTNPAFATRRSLSGTPTKASAMLGRQSFSQMAGCTAHSATWDERPAGPQPVRVLLGLPAEGADAVLVQFQEQFSTLPFLAEALPATGPAALLSAAANAAAFGTLDAVLLHVSYLRPGAPGIACGADLVGILREMGVKACIYGCDVGGPPEDVTDAASLLDGWIEGPTWATPLNSRQLAALLLMMNAARAGPHSLSPQAHSRPASLRGAGPSFGGTGPILRSRSSGNFGGMLTTGALSSRPSFDAGHMHHLNSAVASGPASPRTYTSTTPREQPSVALKSPAISHTPAAGVEPGARAVPAGAALPAMSDAEILQQLMNEISTLKKELGDKH